jgi:hypothetical protein
VEDSDAVEGAGTGDVNRDGEKEDEEWPDRPMEVEVGVVADAVDGFEGDPKAGGDHEEDFKGGREAFELWTSSAGTSEARTARRVMPAAMRSMAEWAASESMPREPVRTPVRSLRRVMPRAAKRDDCAAERLEALRWAAASRFVCTSGMDF